MLGQAMTGYLGHSQSYRFLHSSAAAKKRIKAREQARKGGKAEPAAGDS
jgi:hypothetical protein